jgi:hypothetical protein
LRACHRHGDANGVALKFLPDAFAHDVIRAARFDREAKALASLNHPHIAASAP